MDWNLGCDRPDRPAAGRMVDPVLDIVFGILCTDFGDVLGLDFGSLLRSPPEPKQQ